MNNFETAESLIMHAERCLKEAQGEFEDGFWNLTIRRAQETVEASLKSLLKAVGVEYPKEHDVGGLFARISGEKRLEVAEEALEEITGLSKQLAEWRSPAFYMEERYDESQARWAAEGAEMVLQLAKELLPKLKGQ